MHSTPLPLSSRPWVRGSLDDRREDEIERLVNLFYANGRQDPLLGPVFEAAVSDWATHLTTMRDFWSSAIYRTGRYSGRPLDAHRALAGLTFRHFERWLKLWEDAVDRVVTTEEAADFKRLSRMMAATMSRRLGFADDADCQRA